MPGYDISICNYKFSAVRKTAVSKKIVREVFEIKMNPLIGGNKDEIIQDPTGQNQKTIRRVYGRKTKSNHINETIFTIIHVEIVKIYGQTTWIEKKV